MIIEIISLFFPDCKRNGTHGYASASTEDAGALYSLHSFISSSSIRSVLFSSYQITYTDMIYPFRSEERIRYLLAKADYSDILEQTENFKKYSDD